MKLVSYVRKLILYVRNKPVTKKVSKYLWFKQGSPGTIEDNLITQEIHLFPKEFTAVFKEVELVSMEVNVVFKEVVPVTKKVNVTCKKDNSVDSKK